jgi:hypothetical protein
MKFLLPFVVLLALGACAADPFEQDQFAQPGTWAPTNDNDANLRAMVENPHDLVAGRPMDGALGAEAAVPVKQLLAGKRAALPTTAADTVYAGSGSGNGGSGAGGSGASGGSNGGG